MGRSGALGGGRLELPLRNEAVGRLRLEKVMQPVFLSCYRTGDYVCNFPAGLEAELKLIIRGYGGGGSAGNGGKSAPCLSARGSWCAHLCTETSERYSREALGSNNVNSRAVFPCGHGCRSARGFVAQLSRQTEPQDVESQA